MTATLLSSKVLFQDIQKVTMHHRTGTLWRTAHDILTVYICGSTLNHMAGGSKIDAEAN